MLSFLRVYVHVAVWAVATMNTVHKRVTVVVCTKIFDVRTSTILLQLYKRLSTLSLELFNRLVAHGNLHNDKIFSLTVNLWSYSEHTQELDEKILVSQTTLV